MTKIVVLDGATLNPGDNPWTDLHQLGDVDIFERTALDQISRRAQDAAVLVINKVRITAELLGQLPALRLIAVTATGYDCVDVGAAQRHGVVVCNVPVYGTDSVAQHIMALLLHVLHRVDLHDAAIRQGEWEERGDFSFWNVQLTELAGKTFGVIGFGRIGRRVAELAHAFGMSVLAHTRHRDSAPNWQRFAWSELVPLVEQSDVVSLNCPLTEATTRLVNAQLLDHFRPSAILINAARGPLIVEEDLARSLNTGQLAAAALDVVAVEPITSDSPLLTARNCFLTPHQAWATVEARKRLMQITVQNVANFLNGNPVNVVG